MPTEDQGLTSAEAKKRLEKFGPNILPEKPPPSDLFILLSQLKSPLVYVLMAAGVVTLILGETSDSAIIFFAVFINTVLGFFQERKAGHALAALKKLIHPKARVVRDGRMREIDVEGIVPGDLVVLRQGDKAPADGQLVSATRLFVSEAILTGEAAPVGKGKGEEIFLGTTVSGGEGRVIVEKTGAESEVGKIAESVQEPSEDTPLRRQLSVFSRQLSILVLGLTVFVFVVGIASERGMVEILTTSVALAVSAIPEGLLVALTVSLAVGMQRILARRGLTRNLLSAETLGGVTTICTDKTGTLTQGKLKVVEAIGDYDEVVEQIALTGDDPIMAISLEWVKEKAESGKLKTESLERKHPRIDHIPFSPQNRFFASLNRLTGSSNVVFVNGAPELLLDWSNVAKSERANLKRQIVKLTSDGKRVIGLAQKEVSSSVKKIIEQDIEKDLSWVGLLVFSDPVRLGVKDALDKAVDAGIKILVITGDYSQTASFVMRQLGIEVNEKNIILGHKLEKMTVGEVAKLLKSKKGKDFRLFARTRPQQKLKIIEALKLNNEVVAMMGDGVNDAPALNRADIGIVVGDATDVAKESADLVLLDSSFDTIIAAIEEGRGIFDNIRKVILYLMSDSFEEIFAVVGTILLSVTLIPGLPLPITAAQILWINLVSDGFPHLALAVDPKRPGIMNRPPRSPKENLVEAWMTRLIMIVSVTGGIMALLVFIVFYKLSGDIAISRSVAFATLGVNSLIYVFSIRTLTEPFWSEKLFENKWLNIAVAVGFVFQFIPFLSPSLRDFFGLASLQGIHLAAIFSASAVMFIIIEASKVVFRRLLTTNQNK